MYTIKTHNGMTAPTLSDRRESVTTFAPDNEISTATQDTNVEEKP